MLLAQVSAGLPPPDSNEMGWRLESSWVRQI